MHRQYGLILHALGRKEGMLGVIFKNAKNKIRDPRKLRLLVDDLFGKTDWTHLSADVKGDAYEGLLEKNARDTKSGAGQYFTPRPLIDAITFCIAPKIGETICDPACGTGGFLLSAYEYIRSSTPRMSSKQRSHITNYALRGVELVEEVARLSTMNLLLHGVEAQRGGDLPIRCEDSLRNPPECQFDIVMTNPPFGTRGSITYTKEERSTPAHDDLTVVRADFWEQTANKQLNFLQHVYTLLRPGGRAAIVIPDNVLFERGAGTRIRRHLLEHCNVHTLLRLPSGLFYASGVKANVLFFDRLHGEQVRERNRHLCIYDLRADRRFSLKTKPLGRADLVEFKKRYTSDRQGSKLVGNRPTMNGPGRWRRFDLEEIMQSDECNLDISWNPLRRTEPTASLSRLDELSKLIADDLILALKHIRRASKPPQE